MDTVRAGPVAVRADVSTGRRRSGPDRTEQPGGPDFRDRTGRCKARCGPPILTVQRRPVTVMWTQGVGAVVGTTTRWPETEKTHLRSGGAVAGARGHKGKAREREGDARPHG